MIDVAIGDIHSRTDAFRALLERLGIITITSGDPMTDVRNDGFRIHQLGDALSLGYGEKEIDFYRYFWHVISDDDVICLGNHELPVVWHDRMMDFSGIDDHDKEAWEMVKSKWDEGRFVAASHVGDWLLSHAGLAATHQSYYRSEDYSTQEIAQDLNRQLLSCIESRTPVQCHGPIAGMYEHSGGIFWARLDRSNYIAGKPLRQVYGHTPAGPNCVNNMWLIDTAPRYTEELKRKLMSGIRPMRSEFGDVAALLWETPNDEPILVRPYEDDDAEHRQAAGQ